LLQFIEIRALIVVVVVVVGHGNLQYNYIWILSHWNSVVLKLEHLLYFLLQSTKTYSIFTLKCLALIIFVHTWFHRQFR
jgi:hypothetical protein